MLQNNILECWKQKVNLTTALTLQQNDYQICLNLNKQNNK